MTRKRKFVPQDDPPGWTVSTTWTSPSGRKVSPGTELSITGERGRFRFVKHVQSPTSEWVDVIGGKKGMERFRSFRIEKVKTVHRLNRTRANLLGR